MAAEDVELIGRMFRAWNSGDMATLTDVFDADVEVRPALSAFLASTVYRGHDGVAAWYQETYEPWVELHADPQRFIDAGGGRWSWWHCTRAFPAVRWRWRLRSRMS